MQLFDRALDTYRVNEVERSEQRRAWVKQKIRELEARVEQTFGIPFSEAFDTTKVMIDHTGDPFIVVDNFYTIREDEGYLIVEIGRADAGQKLGSAYFNWTGEDHYAKNLDTLGHLLAEAHIKPYTEECA